MYLISYDLKQPGRNYPSLIEAIARLAPTRCPVTQSTWLVEYHGSAANLRDELLGYIDANDRLFVVSVHAESAWHGLPDEVANWLRERMPTARANGPSTTPRYY